MPAGHGTVLCTAALGLLLVAAAALRSRPALGPASRHSTPMGAADVLLDLAATWSGAGRPGSGRGLDEAPEPPLWRQRVAAAAAAGRLDAAGGGRAPVIFIPPLTGVQLELSLHNK